MKCRVPDEEQREIEAEADELGISRAKYVRQLIRTGRLLRNGNSTDIERLNELITEEDKTDKPTSDESLSTVNEDISEKILRELPTDDADQGVTTEELRELIFGSEDEQLEQLKDTLEELYQRGKVDRAFHGGYVRTDE